ncbi:MAG: ABC transporter permease [Alphaproteobacteria bacterium]|nr:ABC transporter permease [Alphaproteobacteria bacterium]
MFRSWLHPLVALVVTLLVMAGVLLIVGQPPLLVFRTLLVQPWLVEGGFGAIINRATPLLICAIGLSFGFRAGVWNLGAEGQFIVGASAATLVALMLPVMAPLPALGLMALAGGIGGGLWALLPAWLFLKFKADLLLVSLMLVFVAQSGLQGLIFGIWRDPAGYNYPQTAIFAPQFLLPKLTNLGSVSTAALIGLLVLALGWFMQRYSAWSFGLRLGRDSPGAAAVAGYSRLLQVVTTMVVGGVAAGVAGMTEVSGSLGQLSLSIVQNHGFTAILVAYLGRLSAGGMLVSSLFLAVLTVGGEGLRIGLAMPEAFVMTLEGLILVVMVALNGLMAGKSLGRLNYDG